MASTVYQRMANRGEIDKENVVVFKKSSLLPLAPQTYRGDLCESLKEDIREAHFTFAEEAPDAEKLLEPMGAKRFESMADSDFDRIRDIIELSSSTIRSGAPDYTRICRNQRLQMGYLCQGLGNSWFRGGWWPRV